MVFRGSYLEIPRNRAESKAMAMLKIRCIICFVSFLASHSFTNDVIHATKMASHVRGSKTSSTRHSEHSHGDTITSYY